MPSHCNATAVENVLTILFPMHPCSAPEIVESHKVLKGYRKDALGANGPTN